MEAVQGLRKDYFTSPVLARSALLYLAWHTSEDAACCYGVVGNPIAHSLSPRLHGAAFAATGVPGAFVPWRVEAADLPAFVQEVRSMPVRGVGVTLPHKEQMLKLVDEATPLAQQVGAVNTLFWKDGKLWGHNTDVEGFQSPLVTHGPFNIALVLGAGGAARAAVVGLKTLPRPPRILVTSRRPEQAAALAESLGVQTVLWGEREKQQPDLIVNTTPVGLDASELSPFTVFPSYTGWAYDLIYLDTPFLRAAKAAGWQCLDGMPMFLAQAKLQYQLWTGKDMPATIGEALRSR